MRPLSRMAVTAAATAIASVTALSGAALANAQVASPVFNSPSSVNVEGKGASTKVTYRNESERDLLCTAFAGPDRLIADFYSYTKKTGDTGGAELPAELNLRMLTALTTGKLGLYMGTVDDGQSAVLPSAFDLPGLELPDGAVGLTDVSFTPAAMAICMNPDGGEYVEIESSAGAGVPTGLGSLDSALAGLGSSGSVAETTGSLGS